VIFLKFAYNLNSNNLFQYEEERILFYDCNMEYTETTTKCTINEFSLPQSFEGLEKPKEWIEGFGDPEFLVYFEKFPIGEDKSWSSFNTWLKGARTIMFASMCVSSIVLGTMTAVRAPQKAVSTVIRRSIGLADNVGDVTTNMRKARQLSKTLKKTISTTEGVIDKIDDASDMTKFGTSVLGQVDELAATTGKMQKLVDDLGASYGKAVKLKAAGLFAGELGVTTALAFGASLLDSHIGKYFDDGKESKIVLQRPLTPVKINDVAGKVNSPTGQNPIETGRPVLLDKKGRQDDSPFYLASPCRADLTVEMKDVVCGYYQYDSTEGDYGSVTCENPKIGLSDNKLDNYPECGLDRDLAEFYSEDIFNTITTLNGWEGPVIDYSGPTDRFVTPTKIYMPILTNEETGKVFISLNDITQEYKEMGGMWIEGDDDQAYADGDKVVYEISVNVEADEYGRGTECLVWDKMYCTTVCALEDLEESLRMHSIPVGFINRAAVEGDCGEGLDLLWHCSNVNFQKSELTSHSNEKCEQLGENIPYNNIYMNFYGYTDIDENNKHLFYQNIGFDRSFWKGNTVIINDYDLDGEMDMFRIKEGADDEIIEMIYSPEGTSVAGFNCRVPSIVIAPDQDYYLDNYKDEENFCYSRNREWLVWVTTIGEIAIDAGALALATTGVGTLISAVASIVTNCAIAAIDAFLIDVNWPSH
jgi:hypothetical protein